MDRTEFERLRDLPGKYVDGDIILQKDGRVYLESEKLIIVNSDDVDATVLLRWNPETDSKTVNVIVSGLGPVCRLDVDGTVHAPAGRHHKHSLVHPDCPVSNLGRGVVRRDDLAGQDIATVWTEFCRMANIEHRGQLRVIES